MALLLGILRLAVSAALWWARGRMARYDSWHKALRDEAKAKTPAGSGDMTDRAIEWAVSAVQLVRIDKLMRHAARRYDVWTWRESALSCCQAWLRAAAHSARLAFVLGVLTTLEGAIAYRHGPEAYSWCVEKAQQVSKQVADAAMPEKEAE